MNVLREIRRLNKKSIKFKIRVIILLIFLLVVSIYAWWYTGSDAELGGLEGNIESWDIQYVIKDGDTETTPTDDELLNKEFTMNIDELYPGMEDYTKNVKIYNMGSLPSEIFVEVTSIKVFGEELIGTLASSDSIKYYDGSKTAKLFENANYPFDIGYTYDKKIIQGQYKSETDTTAKATFTFNVKWNLDNGSDDLDTKFGKDAYSYYQNKTAEATESSIPAIEVKVKITAKKYDP